MVEDEIHRYTTLSYRSPEMIDFYNNHDIHIQSDIWVRISPFREKCKSMVIFQALGIMLYKLCYFSLPFGESTLAIQNGAFQVPDTPEFPREMHAFMR